MFIQPYSTEELELSFCNRVYFRFGSNRSKPIEPLPRLTKQIVGDLLVPYDIHLLELAATNVDLRILVSLTATESVSAAASKIKGHISKRLSYDAMDHLPGEQQKWLGRGYFAATTGHTRTAEVASYFERQTNHHGYDDRPRSPTYVDSFALDESLLATDHAVARLRYHLVFATEARRGVFHDVSAPRVTEAWRRLEPEWKAVIEKVSFLPDHVHIAVSVHPVVSPAALVVALMNEAQEIVWEHFAGMLFAQRSNACGNRVPTSVRSGTCEVPLWRRM
ncbi:transposase [Pirellulaceae bacterium SH449]